jgi:hypothetical protein
MHSPNLPAVTGLDPVLQRSLARRHKSKDSYGWHLPPKKVAELQAAGQSVPVQFRFVLDKILSETSNYLGSLESSVRGGKCVDEAADFSRWLQFSGVLSMLEMFAELNPDFKALRRRVTDLTLSCGPHLRGGRVAASYCQSDIDSINGKLDVLLSAFAKQATAVPKNTLHGPDTFPH